MRLGLWANAGWMPFIVGCTLCEVLGDCPASPEETGTTDAPQPAPPDATGTPAPAPQPMPTPMPAPLPNEPWTQGTHPCGGNRVSDLLWEPGAVWLGCGEDSAGEGLFTSTDDGATWGAPPTSPADYFADFRVISISRSADGSLYVAGDDTLSSIGAVRVAPTAPFAVTTVYEGTGVIWNTWGPVGTFRRTSLGVAAAESLNGTGAVTRTADVLAWEDGADWGGSGPSRQILDLEIYDDQFYGVGSRISEPPYVFVPQASDTTTFDMAIIPVSTAFDGELWAIDVDAGGIVAGGVDQDDNVGVIFTGELDARETLDFAFHAVSDELGGAATWVRGVCRSGDTLAAVGEFSQLSDGFVLVSTDEGATWTDQTPSGDVPPLQDCDFAENGTLLVAGGGGFFARRAL